MYDRNIHIPKIVWDRLRHWSSLYLKDTAEKVTCISKKLVDITILFNLQGSLKYLIQPDHSSELPACAKILETSLNTVVEPAFLDSHSTGLVGNN